MALSTPIVLTNDDGIDAPGLRALAAEVQRAAASPVYIVAPDRGYSGCSQQITMHEPIAVEQRGPREFAVSGSPGDCVRLARFSLVPDCKLVLSGINHGGNLGHDILLSGTVGAAREAAMLGIHAVAFSHYLRGGLETDWPRAAAWALAVLDSLTLDSSGEASLWNVNFPHLDEPAPAMPPVVRCRPCSRPLPIAYTQRNGLYAYDGGRYHARAREAGTDVEACFGGAIALSRLATGVGWH